MKVHVRNSQIEKNNKVSYSAKPGHYTAFFALDSLFPEEETLEMLNTLPEKRGQMSRPLSTLLQFSLVAQSSSATLSDFFVRLTSAVETSRATTPPYGS